MTKYNKRKRIQKIKRAVGEVALLVLIGFAGCAWACAYSTQVI